MEMIEEEEDKGEKGRGESVKNRSDSETEKKYQDDIPRKNKMNN